MSGWVPNLFGRKDATKSAADAIVSLREQLAMVDKKEENLDKRIEEEHRKAKTLVAAKKPTGATAALRRKKALETQRDQLDGTRLTLETQLNALESANFNARTFAALSNSQKALKQVHKELNITNVENILDEMRIEIENAQTIQEAISAPMGGETIDEEDLLRELEDLEQEALDERLSGADTIPAVPTQALGTPGYQQLLRMTRLSS